jgi:dolichyl-phosphate-mannose--protein O-mannosyl transferase
VTSYGHKDENNKFLVKKWNIEPPAIYSEEWDKADVELVKHGDLIR